MRRRPGEEDVLSSCYPLATFLLAQLVFPLATFLLAQLASPLATFLLAQLAFPLATFLLAQLAFFRPSLSSLQGVATSIDADVWGMRRGSETT